ncbi:hypothetical protein EYE40_11385 [Glaciihabitans arcticus]|uniref:Uncharacterized protein n=1 Tax=Glaciihabitans arcticus TaxID=2668039 RepID=A0A4Q9GSH0_9MICO|nr:hypothetical protein [Glaciihabitans arcticus]TBN57952.1 hypothetical protein EYE40_11385 [Glaciihabitans arcticus]
MRKLVGMVAVLLLLSGCTMFDAEARRTFERHHAEKAAVLALQNRLERMPGVEVATVGITAASGLLDANGSPTDKDSLGVWVTMPRVETNRLVEVAAAVREVVRSGPLAAAHHELIVQAGGREALRMNQFELTDQLLLDALDYWFAVRALVDPALSLTIGYPGFGGDYSRIITAPVYSPEITAAYTAAFPEIVEIPDVTLGMPVVELTGFRLVGELPPREVMETFGRIIPSVRLLSRDYYPGRQGHVLFEWRYSPIEKTGAVYSVHAIQETDTGEGDLEKVVDELARSAVGPTTVRSYLITRPGFLRFNCEPAEYPYPNDFTLVASLRDLGMAVTAEENAGYCA